MTRHQRHPLPPTLRLAVGVGDPERERALLPALDDAGDVLITDRCLSADELLAACANGHQVDAVLLAFDLHRLGGDALDELQRSRVPLVLLAPDPDARRWQTFAGVVVPLDADAALVRQALDAARHGERLASAGLEVENPAQDAQPVQVASSASAALVAEGLAVLALVSGHGSPGRTTIAASLAAALGAVTPTALVDCDLNGPSVAAQLDLDPTRNLYMVAHAEPESPRDWDRALEQELQPLCSTRSPYAVALCGVPKPEMRTALTRAFIERLLGELRQRYGHVVIDLGADLIGSDAAAAVQRAVPALADRVLLVASPDIMGLWHARSALGFLRDQLHVDADQVALLLNRYDRRYHLPRSEIEWSLGVPAAAVVPFDHHAAQRSLAAQHPLVLEGGRSRAARALLDLAERVHGGAITLPPEAADDKRQRWLKAVSLPWRSGRARAPGTPPTAPDTVSPTLNGVAPHGPGATTSIHT